MNGKFDEVEEIEDTLNFLCKHYDKYTSDPKIKPYISKIEKYRKSALLIKAIQQRYRPTQINVNTVGAYLWGCFQNFYGSVNRNCSALCVNSISHSINTMMSEDSLNCEKCQYSIWTYTNKKLTNDFNTSSSKAYIYVDSDWEGFSDADIDILKKSGILFASIFDTNHSLHKVILPMTSLDNLPISKEYPTFSKEKIIHESYSWLFVLLIVILFIFFYVHYKYM